MPSSVRSHMQIEDVIFEFAAEDDADAIVKALLLFDIFGIDVDVDEWLN